MSHAYLAPALQAVPGSTHGYDVADPTALSAELGGALAFRRMTEALRAHGLEVLLDIVPNHMAADWRTPWWSDVLADGRGSPFADVFDIDWTPPRQRLLGRVLVPVLADHVGRVIDAGGLRLAREGGRVVVRCNDAAYPVRPETTAELLAAAAQRAGGAPLHDAATALRTLEVAVDAAGRVRRAAARREAERLLATLVDGDRGAAAALDAELQACSADPVRLDALLEAQHHRLARWRTAMSECNYRRFFDITGLVGVRVEHDDVFDAVHTQVSALVRARAVDGVRVDHVDGLRDPAGYLRRLRDTLGEEAWIVVEKILGGDERLRPEWPVDGTTGYEHAAMLTGLFVDPRGEAPLTALWQEMGGQADAAAMVRDAKLLVMRQSLDADVTRLVRLLRRVCDARPRHRDHTEAELRAALLETLAALDVYRTYAVQGATASATDRARIEAAIGRVRARRPDVDAALLDLLGDVLATPAADDGDATELALRLQQTATAVAAKGVEDTFLYRHHRLAALCEVGADPLAFGTDLATFHRRCAEQQERHPLGLVTTSTHDTKRSADVRARLAVLSEIPQPWAEAVRRWREHNARHRRDGMPDAPTEYLLYQTLVGAHPLGAERAAAYMEKATREAKLHTSWIDPHPAYDAAVREFTLAVCGDPWMREQLEEFTAPLLRWGRVASLAQTLLHLTMPGVPDVYQGAEVWDLSLVDPDNRRPVDWARLQALLDGVVTATPEDAMARDDEGATKLLVVHRALRLRRARPELFGPRGAYTPLAVHGARADNVVAFARGAPPGCITVAPRLVVALDGGWQDTTVKLPRGAWRDELSGETCGGGAVQLASLLQRLPLTLLSRVS